MIALEHVHQFLFTIGMPYAAAILKTTLIFFSYNNHITSHNIALYIVYCRIISWGESKRKNYLMKNCFVWSVWRHLNQFVLFSFVQTFHYNWIILYIGSKIGLNSACICFGCTNMSVHCGREVIDFSCEFYFIQDEDEVNRKR